MTELLEALYRGQQDRVDQLLAASPDLNVFEAAAFGDNGFQPLTLACFFGHVEASRLLLEHGADPNTLGRNEHVQTNALHAAAASENKDASTRYELCRLLLDHGADPNLPQGTNEFRAIDAARQNGDA